MAVNTSRNTEARRVTGAAPYPTCVRCHNALDDYAVNGVCSRCRQSAPAPAKPEPWQFDQRPLVRSTQMGPTIHAIGQSDAQHRWGVTLMGDARLIGHYTPDQARILAFDILQMVEVCEGLHASKVRT